MRIKLSIHITVFYSVLALLSTSHAATDFDFGFEASPSSFDPLPGNCGVGGVGGKCDLGFLDPFEPDPDTTPFFQDTVVVNGETYWHTIVGDPSSGFAMESYTRVASGTGFVTNYGSFSGGRPGNWSAFSLEGYSGNGWDPLGLTTSGGVNLTGNGSGDPTKTVFRQVMGDGVWDATNRTYTCDTGEFCAEFLKSGLNAKPIFGQAINDDTGGALMQLRFQVDMSNSSYSDMATTGTIINTITLTDPSDSEFYRVLVNAGRFRYNDCSITGIGGSCWQSFSEFGGPSNYIEGSYTYSDGGTDPMSYDWGTFFDLTQNPFSGNKSKCNSPQRPSNC